MFVPFLFLLICLGIILFVCIDTVQADRSTKLHRAKMDSAYLAKAYEPMGECLNCGCAVRSFDLCHACDAILNYD